MAIFYLNPPQRISPSWLSTTSSPRAAFCLKLSRRLYRRVQEHSVREFLFLLLGIPRDQMYVLLLNLFQWLWDAFLRQWGGMTNRMTAFGVSQVSKNSHMQPGPTGSGKAWRKPTVCFELLLLLKSLNKLQHANLHLYLRKDTRHVVYKANTLTYHEVAARAQWITHKHTIKDTKHLMRLSGLYLWFSTSDFWKFRCVARWFWFILRGELLRNPIWFSAVRTKAIDYGENKDRLAVREFNSFGGAEHRRLLGLLLKTEKRKTWYFLGRTLYMHHIGVMNCLYYFVLLDTSVWIQIIWMLMGIIKPVLSYIFQQFQNLGWYFDEKNDI